MQTFGCHDTFGVDLELYKDSVRPWMYGRFCIWVDGRSLGSVDQELISDAIPVLEWWQHRSGCRGSPALFRGEAQTVFFSLEGARYGLDHLTELMPLSFRRLPVPETGRFEFGPFVGHDDARIYVVEEGAAARVLYNRANGPPGECRLDRLTFEDTVSGVLCQLKTWYAGLKPVL